MDITLGNKFSVVRHFCKTWHFYSVSLQQKYQHKQAFAEENNDITKFFTPKNERRLHKSDGSNNSEEIWVVCGDKAAVCVCMSECGISDKWNAKLWNRHLTVTASGLVANQKNQHSYTELWKSSEWIENCKARTERTDTPT